MKLKTYWKYTKQSYGDIRTFYLVERCTAELGWYPLLLQYWKPEINGIVNVNMEMTKMFSIKLCMQLILSSEIVQWH
jgi:hypothetical protein